MAGTKHSAEAMGFVFLPPHFLLCKKSGKKEIFVRAAVKKDESVGERSAVGEA